MNKSPTDYQASMLWMGKILVRYAGCASFRIRSDVYLRVTVDKLPVHFDVLEVGDVLRCSADVVNVPPVKQRTHWRRCVELANLMAADPGYGRFAVTEMGHGCRVQWHMQVPAVLLESPDEVIGGVMKLGIEELVLGFKRYLHLLESADSYVSAVYDYDDTRPTGRA